ncbi:MAG: hypothetical protein ABI651_15090, partial [Verrucomicrobiota bacterium]
GCEHAPDPADRSPRSPQPQAISQDGENEPVTEFAVRQSLVEIAVGRRSRATEHLDAAWRRR